MVESWVVRAPIDSPHVGQLDAGELLLKPSKEMKDNPAWGAVMVHW